MPGVSRAGYYEWLRRRNSDRSKDDERIVAHIKAVHSEHKRRYGSPRMTVGLQERGIHVNRKKVERLMRERGFPAVYPEKFRKTTDSDHKQQVAPSLLAQNFRVSARDRVWVGDITYVWTMEGWVCLAVLSDLYSRRVVAGQSTKRFREP